MSFTDQKRREATEDDCKAPWGGFRDGSRFRCYLCGHKFTVGDGFRWVYSAGMKYERDDGKTVGVINFMTCDTCDGDDVSERWLARNKEFSADMRNKYWALD